MKRSAKPRHIGLKAPLLATLLVAGLVLAFFQLVSPTRLAGTWPLGITQDEVDRYARWTTFPWDRPANAVAPLWTLGASAGKGACMADHQGRRAHARWFTAGDHADSVRVKRHPEVEGGLILTFRREAPLKGQRRVELLPATATSIRAKYLEILADELGLPVAEVSFVRLASCGDTATYLKREWMGRVLLEKRMITDALSYRQAFHPWQVTELFPKVPDDTASAQALRQAWSALQLAGDSALLARSLALVDHDAALSWLLLRWLEGHPDALRTPGHFAYRHEMARIMPLYVPSPGTPPLADGIVRPWSVNPFTPLLRDTESRERFLAQRARLVEERWRIRERFAAADEAWLPLLANGVPLELVQRRARRMQEELLDGRLLDGDPVADQDRKLVPGAGMATFVQGAASAQGAAAGAGQEEQLFARLKRMKVQRVGDTLVFPRGRYILEEDLLIPPGIDVVVQKGARFELGPGVNVLVRGGLTVQGTAINPVFVRAQQDNSPYGTFAVAGDGRSQVRISGLRMSGGSEGFVAGMYHSGMLSVRGAAFTAMKGCVIGGSRGEDAVNIKGGRVMVEDCEFLEGFADLLDIDVAEGVVRGCTFRTPGTDGNGDGLDVSGATLLVERSRFLDMRDKGLSVGEGSNVLVRNNRFERNTMGIAVKDLSVAHVVDNVFLGNRTALAVYRKKPILGGGTLHLYTNVFQDNAQERTVDEHSAVVTGDAPDAGVIQRFTELP